MTASPSPSAVSEGPCRDPRTAHSRCLQPFPFSGSQLEVAALEVPDQKDQGWVGPRAPPAEEFRELWAGHQHSSRMGPYLPPHPQP